MCNIILNKRSRDFIDSLTQVSVLPQVRNSLLVRVLTKQTETETQREAKPQRSCVLHSLRATAYSTASANSAREHSRAAPDARSDRIPEAYCLDPGALLVDARVLRLELEDPALQLGVRRGAAAGARAPPLTLRALAIAGARAAHASQVASGQHLKARTVAEAQSYE